MAAAVVNQFSLLAAFYRRKCKTVQSYDEISKLESLIHSGVFAAY